MASLLRLAKDALIYGLGGVLGRFVGIFLVPILTRAFTPADYGVIDLITTIMAFAVAIVTLGLDSAIGYYFYQDQNEKERHLTVSTTTLFLFATAIIGGVALLSAAPLFSQLFFRGAVEVTSVMRLAFVALPFAVLSSLFLSILRLRFERWRYAALAIAQILLGAIATLYAVLILQRGLLGLYGASLVVSFIFFFVSFLSIHRFLRLRFDSKRLRRLLRFGLPLVPAGLALSVLSLADRFFLAHYSTLTELGLYSIGNQISNSVLLLVAGFQLAWGPYAFSVAGIPEAKELYARTLKYYVVVMGLFAFIISLFGYEILRIFTTQAYISAYRVIPLLSFSLVAYGAYYIVSIGANLAKKTEYVTFSTLVAATVNIILNFLLIPPYGMMGAAAATLVAYVISTIILYMLSQRVYPIPYKVMYSTLLPIIWLTMGVAVLFVRPTDHIALSIIVKSCLLVIVLMLMLTSGMLDRGEVIALGRQLLPRLLPKRRHAQR